MFSTHHQESPTQRQPPPLDAPTSSTGYPGRAQSAHACFRALPPHPSHTREAERGATPKPRPQRARVWPSDEPLLLCNEALYTTPTPSFLPSNLDTSTRPPLILLEHFSRREPPRLTLQLSPGSPRTSTGGARPRASARAPTPRWGPTPHALTSPWQPLPRLDSKGALSQAGGKEHKSGCVRALEAVPKLQQQASRWVQAPTALPTLVATPHRHPLAHPSHRWLLCGALRGPGGSTSSLLNQRLDQPPLRARRHSAPTSPPSSQQGGARSAPSSPPHAAVVALGSAAEARGQHQQCSKGAPEATIAPSATTLTSNCHPPKPSGGARSPPAAPHTVISPTEGQAL